MSVLTSFVISHLVPALESALLSHLPQEQEVIIAELEVIIKHLANWLENKIKEQQ